MSTNDSPTDRAPGDDEPPARDAVAWSRHVEEAGRCLLESGDVETGLEDEIRIALQQVQADRVEGEPPDEATHRLAELLHRHELLGP